MENIRMDLRLFDANTQVTTQQSLTEEMKTFYSDYLIDAAEPELVHDQFAQKHPIPANGGKTIQFRRFAPLGKALTALTEGVTPDGQSLSMSTVEAAVRQYGGYIQMSDLLLLTAIDNNLTMATKLLGAQGVQRTLSAGHAAIAADDRTDVRAAFTVAVTGLRQLAEGYPGHVAEGTGRTPAQEEPNGSTAAGCCPGAVPGSGQQRKKET